MLRLQGPPGGGWARPAAAPPGDLQGEQAAGWPPPMRPARMPCGRSSRAPDRACQPVVPAARL
eukprot:8668823-Lingulodinium_polyedra.AAC.1